MEVRPAIPIILLAVLVGAALSLTGVHKVDEAWLKSPEPAGEPENGNASNVTHEHALMYVVVNGTELSFLEPRYQLAAGKVHLENNKSHIVHKHRTGVTWKDFLDTINASFEHVNGSEYCAEFKNHSYCGDAGVRLNGEKVEDLGKEIEQGDKLIIILQPDYRKLLKRYSSKELPEPYRAERGRGFSL